MPARLDLSQSLQDMLIEHVFEVYPQEACGFISGRNQLASRVLRLTNTATNPHHAFDAASDELLRVFKDIEAQGESLVAIYHSHPHSSAILSEHDLKHATLHYPHIPQLIIGLRPSLDIKAWIVIHDQPVQVKLVIRDAVDEAAPKRLTAVAVTALLIAVLLSLLIFFAISLSLLPPAPPIPTPAG